jgi:enoyl-CoA hydratase/carnithine racemase
MTAETVILNRVVEDAELDAAVGALAETIAAQPPLALRHAKRAIDAFADQERSLQLAAEGQAACLRSEDFIEAGKAFREGRAPDYRGR